MQNPKSICALEKSARDVPCARIDPSRRGVMTEAIFVLPKITRGLKTTKNAGKPRKSWKIGFYSISVLMGGPIFPLGNTNAIRIARPPGKA